MLHFKLQEYKANLSCSKIQIHNIRRQRPPSKFKIPVSSHVHVCTYTVENDG